MIRLLPVVALALVLGGCAATPVTGAAAPQGSSVTSAEAAAAQAAGGGGGGGAPVDACALVPAADIKALIGPNDGGKTAGPVADGGECDWTNTDNQYNVTVHIGSSGTAINGLPALDPAVGTAEPLPDGMRFFAEAVDFVAKDRACYVQVSTLDTTDGGDKAAAVKLAKAVQAKI